MSHYEVDDYATAIVSKKPYLPIQVFVRDQPPKALCEPHGILTPSS